MITSEHDAENRFALFGIMRLRALHQGAVAAPSSAAGGPLRHSVPSFICKTRRAIHDDLVTPGFAAGRLGLPPRFARHRDIQPFGLIRTGPMNRPAADIHRADIQREYGPFPDADQVHGVTFDGRHVWFASGDKLNVLDPAKGKLVRAIDATAHAGTAFDGRHLFQIAEDRIQKIDPETGRVLATIPAPGGGGDSGLAWAEGTLWVGQYRDRRIHQIDTETGAILRTIESNRFVTGVTWVDGELWHGTSEEDESELRRIDPATGRVLERIEMPPGIGVSGLESDGGDQFFCGGGKSGRVRVVRRPRSR